MLTSCHDCGADATDGGYSPPLMRQGMRLCPRCMTAHWTRYTTNMALFRAIHRETLMRDEDPQLSLFQPTKPTQTYDSIEEAFMAFHKLNPHVYESILLVARDLKRRGLKKVGMKMIFERLRWVFKVQTLGDNYRLNNNFTALYARLVMRQEADLADFFETRNRRTAA